MAAKRSKRVKRKTSKGRRKFKRTVRHYSVACPVPSVKRRTAKGPWIQREGKLGGPGYAERSDRERHHILKCAVDQFGYRSTLGSLLVLLRGKNVRGKVKKIVEQDIEHLKSEYGS